MPFITTTSQHAIHYYDSKSATEVQDKPAIFMIHGLGSSQNYWLAVASALSSYRCVAIDSYGAGRSKSRGEGLSMEGMAADVINVMDQLSVSKAVVAGHSMGGTMACLIAAKYPDRVLGIIPVGPVNPSSVNAEVFKARIQTVLKDGMEPLADTVPTAATSVKSTALTRAFIRELILGSDPKAYASHCQVIVDATDPDYDSIKVPVQIIAGEEDKSAPLEGCKYIHSNLGLSKRDLKVLSGCGHWHCVETPERIAAEIDTFCASL